MAISVLPFFSAFLSTTATGGSARIDSDGTTMSNLSAPPSSFRARKASFSQASNTSPWPLLTKVMVEPRAPVSNTGTCLNSSCT
ncbi:hypothetical protein D3C79_962080 [compost metagenome]